MNLLFFHLKEDFGQDLRIAANNEVDLEAHLISLGYTNIEFSDLRSDYGTCSIKTMFGRETAKCFYITKI